MVLPKSMLSRSICQVYVLIILLRFFYPLTDYVCRLAQEDPRQFMKAKLGNAVIKASGAL